MIKYFSPAKNHDNDSMLLTIFLSRCRVLTSFPQRPSCLLQGLLFKKANHFMIATLNIRSDPMVTWESAKQVQASPPNYQLLIDVTCEEFVNDQQHLGLSAASRIICQSDITIRTRVTDLGGNMSLTNMKCCSLVSSKDLMNKKINVKELSKESMTVTMNDVLNFQS